MPRNGSGVMSIPNTFVDQTTITAGAHNTNWSDAAQRDFQLSSRWMARVK